MAKKEHGPDLGSAKSKATRIQLMATEIQVIEMPDELLSASEEVALSRNRLSAIILDFLTPILCHSCCSSEARLITSGHKSACERTE